MKNRKAVLALALVIGTTGLWGQGLRLKSAAGRPPAAGRTRGTHVILQFPGYPDAALRDRLAGRGIHVLEYVPENALMVSADPSADFSGLGLLWAGSLAAEEKVSPVLAGQVAGPVLAVFHNDVPDEWARRIARWSGFDVLPNPGLLPHHLVLSGPLTRLAGLAAYDEVAYLLPASPDLAAGIPVSGCAGALTEAGPIGEYVLVGNGWSKDSSGKAALQYFIRNLTEKMDGTAARTEIERALTEWTKYANVTISAGQQDGARTIDIQFARGAHGDPYPFDGPGHTLAHTFYPAPPNSEPIAGDMHLDSDESWRSGADTDLFSVVLHEAGHALGLGHSDSPGSVMYPYYRQVTGLSDDDIAGVRALYGAATTAQPSIPIPTTPVIPVQPPVTPPAPGQDNQPPTLQITSPGLTIVSTTGSSLAVSGTASDNVGVSGVVWTATAASGTATGTTSWSATVPLLIGTNTLTVKAYDPAGNSAWRSLTVVRH